MAADGSGNGEGFGQLVELPRGRIGSGKGNAGKGSKGKAQSGNAGNGEPLAKRDKPMSEAKAHFHAVLARESTDAAEIRERAIEAYNRTKGREAFYKREEIIEEVLARMAEGESLNSICRDPRMPSRGLLYLWKAQDPSFADSFASAQESQSHALLDDCIHIADNIQLSGNATADAGPINVAKLRIDSRLRIIAKANPGRYGDRVQHTGANGGPIAVATVTINARDLMPEQRDGLRQMLLAAKGQQEQTLSDDDSEA